MRMPPGPELGGACPGRMRHYAAQSDKHRHSPQATLVSFETSISSLKRARSPCSPDRLYVVYIYIDDREEPDGARRIEGGEAWVRRGWNSHVSGK